MRAHSRELFALAAIALALVGLGGCGPTTDDKPKPAKVTGDPPEHSGHVGPHKGHIIELGRDHQYHGELVHDDKAETASVYILDKAMKESPIDAKSVTITIVADNKPETHELAAVDPKDGKTAHFKGDKKLFEAIEDVEKNPKAKASLTVMIGDKPYKGDIDLHHDDKS
jgi:hypothetical protein